MKRRYTYFILAIVVLIIFCGCQTEVDSNEVKRNIKVETGTINPEAPIETKLMGQLAGTWDAEQTIIAKDGKWPGKRTKAIWRWYYILDGHALQDDWISIDSLGKQKVVGTNIRIYNPEKKSGTWPG